MTANTTRTNAATGCAATSTVPLTETTSPAKPNAALENGSGETFAANFVAALSGLFPLRGRGGEGALHFQRLRFLIPDLRSNRGRTSSQERENLTTAGWGWMDVAG